ncbi:MAG: hypothetical protein JSW56_19790 [Deltaproteobacteria bacterium]|nr:MAG: hypothetical protein JSW56_19790 [Deltaproteobacteria bacterium]
MKHLIIGLLFLLGFFLGSAHAGEIKEFELKDGSVIYGEIVSFSGGTFTLRSKSFGTVEIDESKIRAIRSRVPVGGKGDQIQQLQQRIMSDEEVVQMILSLQNDPDVQKILQDPEIMKAVNSGDINALLSNPKFMKLLENPTIQDIRKKVTE